MQNSLLFWMEIGTILQHTLGSQNFDVVFSRQRAVDDSSNLVLIEFELLPDAVLHGQIARPIRASRPHNDFAFVFKPREQVVAFSCLEPELLNETVKFLCLDRH